MRVVFATKAWEDYLHWADNDRKVFRRLNSLIKECRRTPHEGTGKPEPLKGCDGYWSRRVTEKDRLVYRVEGKAGDQRIEIAQCRLHY
ncbi:Txe/YoeB family addiction module toxin [Sphingomonas edaphi]|uniref:Putative mRNA interferase YoeB n=1 Tax=Sphingomonas edaphi TaxID=2315689 RepID=A0A418PYX5_9SPHN|nr:Txe/YoeB family addiction module toxin [Sphingomonas edaphi]RIX27249.1 Txe/YoeB family addiction module toxin [Sphingomonas edaphi]